VSKTRLTKVCATFVASWLKKTFYWFHQLYTHSFLSFHLILRKCIQKLTNLVLTAVLAALGNRAVNALHVAEVVGIGAKGLVHHVAKGLVVADLELGHREVHFRALGRGCLQRAWQVGEALVVMAVAAAYYRHRIDCAQVGCQVFVLELVVTSAIVKWLLNCKGFCYYACFMFACYNY